MDLTRFNLFRFAHHEQWHSAVWAWCLQSLDASVVSQLAGPRALGKALLRRMGIPKLYRPIVVETEKVLEDCKFDIYVSDSRDRTVVFENKVSAIPDGDQLSRYRRRLRKKGGKLHLGLLSAAFDIDVREDLSRGWQHIDLEDLVKLVRPHRKEHPLLREYFVWLKDQLDTRARLARDACQDDHLIFAEALRHPEGQWALMEFVTAGLSKGRQRRGRNVGGHPWTQFRFAEGPGSRDAISYRIDRSSSGYYFSVRQYQKTPTPTVNAKMKRLRKLRKWWDRALSRKGASLVQARLGNRGKKECEIGRFLLRENPPSRIRAGLPEVHRIFCKKLVQGGWKLW